MSVTSANIDDLATFIDGSTTRTGRLIDTFNAVHTKAVAVTNNCSFQHPSTPSLASLSELLTAWNANGNFVAVIRNELINANQYDGNGNSVVSDAAITTALDKNGLTTPPQIVEVADIELLGSPPYSGWVDDPISMANGNFLMRDGDIQLFGFAAALSVVRSYNSRDGSIGVFGRGWSSILDVALTVGGGRATFRGPDGGGAAFGQREDGTWSRNRRRDLTLVAHDDRWEVLEGRDATFVFDLDGTLTAFTKAGADVEVRRESALVRLHDHTTDRWVDYELDVASGRVETVRTSDGRTATYEWDDEGHLRGVQRPCGKVEYEHDERGLLIGVVDADGIVVCRNTYDDDGRVLSQVENHGRTTSYEYRADGVSTVTASDGAPPNMMVHDRRGRMTAMIDGHGNTMRVTYDDSDEVVQVVDRAGHVTRFSHDERGNVVQRTDPDGLTHTFEWDDLDRLVAETDRADSTTRYVYDGDGRDATLVLQPDGTEVRFTFDDRGLLRSVVDADGVSAAVEWTDDGLMAAVVDGLGGRVERTYDAAGRTATIVTPTGATSALDTDHAGRVHAIALGDAQRTFEYTAAGRLVGGQRVTGEPWRAELDGAGDVVEWSDTDGPLMGFERDSVGRVVTAIAGDGGRYDYEIDAVGRRTATVDPAGNRTETEYDAAGRPIRTTDPSGLSWSWELDFMGRTTATVGPDGARTERTYHPNGQLASETDAAGNRWTYEVDTLGRIVSATDPTGAVTAYGYTSAGRLAEIISPLGRRQRREYDAAGRLASVVEPDGTVVELGRRADGEIIRVVRDGVATEYDYDDQGIVTSVEGPGATVDTTLSAGRLDAVGVNGVTALFEHDARGLVTRVTDPAGVVTDLTYDAAGRLTSATTGTTTLQMEHGPAGHLTALIDPYGLPTTFGHDPRGIIDRVGRPDSSATTRSFGNDGRLLAAHDEAGNALVSVERDVNGRVVGVVAPSGRMDLTYDVLGRTTAVATQAATVSYEWDADGLLVALGDEGAHRATLERTPGGAITGFALADGRRIDLPEDPQVERDEHGRIVHDEHGRTFGYDLAGRIARADIDGETTDYGYDDLGRLATERSGARQRTYRYGLAGELTDIGDDDGTTTSFDHDATGRRTLEKRSDGSTVAYGWDALGRLETVTRTAADGTTTTNRIEHDSLGKPMRIDDTPILWDRCATGTLLGIGDERYVRWGRQVLVATDPDGDWDRHVGGDAWGYDGGQGVRLGYRGELALDGLVFLGARVYDTATRSFLSRDPMPSVPGARAYAAFYAYAWCDPVNLVDPSGLRPLSDDEYDKWLEENTGGFFRDPKNWAKIAVVVGSVALMVTATVFLGPVGTVLAAGAIGALSSGLTTAIDGGDWGDIARSAAIGGATGLIGGGLGAATTAFAPALTSTLPRVIATTAATEYPLAFGSEAADSYLPYGDGTFDVDAALLNGTVGTVSGVVSHQTDQWWTTRQGGTGVGDPATPGANGPGPNGGIDPSGPAPGADGPSGTDLVPDMSRSIDLTDRVSLESIDGIGPTLSRRITEYMEANPNASVDDLINVNGIGESRLGDIKAAIGGG